MLYFLLHDANMFHRRITPALAASWRRRSFGPVVALAAELGPAITAFADRYRLTADEQPLLAGLTADRPFDRRYWRHLAGEVLLYAAADAPAIQTAADTLAVLVKPEHRGAVRQAHLGSGDLDFDGVPYRPGHAGLNGAADVVRLADELAAIDAESWGAAAFAELGDEDERAEELAFARECLAALRDIYTQARGQVVVCEDI
jgi:hypothetical protein